MINKKILLMILFSFAAHMAVAAVIVYVPSEITKDMLAGHPDNVIWGYVSGSAEVEGMRQPSVIPDNVLLKDRGNSSEKVSHTEADIKYNQNENPPSPYPSPLRGEGQGEGGTMAFSSVISDNASGDAPLPGGSSDSGDSICPITSQCGSREGLTDIAASGGFDKHTIMEYVRKEINRHKYYPHIAKLRGIEGTVYVNLYIGQDGIPGGITIARSSGSKILDQAGVQTISKIGKISNVHRELRELDIVVPITYKLE